MWFVFKYYTILHDGLEIWRILVFWGVPRIHSPLTGKNSYTITLFWSTGSYDFHIRTSGDTVLLITPYAPMHNIPRAPVPNLSKDVPRRLLTLYSVTYSPAPNNKTTVCFFLNLLFSASLTVARWKKRITQRHHSHSAMSCYCPFPSEEHAHPALH